MRVRLTYYDPDHGIVSSVYNERDLREWLDQWHDYTGPSEIKLERIL
jgi:hypothetical protein